MLVNNAQVIGLGQCSLDILGKLGQYPELDQKAELSSLLVQGGGPVATAMVTLARLGVPVTFAGAVGGDDFGARVREGLLEEGIDCTHLVTVPEGSTQVAFIAVDQDGHRNIFWHRGSAMPTLPDSFADLLHGPIKVLHLDGLHHDPAFAAADFARSANVLTVLDAGTFRPGVERLLPLIDHLVVSEKFASQAIGRDDPQAALAELARYGAHAVTITLGNEGSMTLDVGGKMFHQEAFKISAEDTTGCGDVFHGGYIYGLLQNWDLRQTVRFASACAALKTRALGGRTAIPKLAEVLEFISTVED